MISDSKVLTSVALMAESLPISLTYDGQDVKNGSMPIGDVVDALQGFSSAYGKIAYLVDSEVTHQIRVAAITKGSFHVDLVVLWAVLSSQEGHLKTIEKIAGAAKYVYGLLISVIKTKKHVKSEPYKISVKGDGNTVIVLNNEGGEIQIPPAALEIFASKLIDSDLKKIVSPLEKGSVDTVELRAEGESDDVIISAEERDSFQTTTTSTSKETELEGTLVSLNKDTKRGTFRLGDDGIPYRYTGNSPEQFFSDFSYKGPVQVTCVAYFDEGLRPTLLEISKVLRLQRELPLSSSDTSSSTDQT